ncbi:MAG: YitT family protein [Firmicutes bacterium]|nr:YitT family protein [Bacillota bacterium]
MEILSFFKNTSQIDMKEIIKKIDSKHLIRRYVILILALLLSATSYNLFFVSGKIVTGGVSGTAIITEALFNINPSTFIFIVNIILMFFSYFLLGKSQTIKNLVGSLLYPIFVSLTSNITSYIDINSADLLIKTLFGAVISGIAGGMIFKVGFSSGGSDIITQILSKYSKISIGKASLIVNTIIIGFSGLIFGWINAMYGVIAIYIITTMTDKVLLGISDNKAFFIITSKEDEIKDFIIDNLKHSVTILKSHGGFTNKNRNVLMVTIPTKEYFIFKESIHEIDPDAFFVVTDSYQVSGGE